MNRHNGYRLWIVYGFIFLGIHFNLSFPNPSEDIYHNYIKKNEIELLHLSNQERKRHLFPLLKRHPLLDRVAKDHSQKMAQEGKLSHDFPNYPPLHERIVETGLYFYFSGENAAFGDTFMANYHHRGLMNSPPHRKNILNQNYTYCGIGMVQNDRGFYVTQVFASLFIPKKAADVEQILEKQVKKLLQKSSRFQNAQWKYFLKEYARTQATNSLSGEKITPIEEDMGSYNVIKIISPRIGDLKKTLHEEIGNFQLIGFALGIKFGREKSNPGGTYTMVCVYFNDLKEKFNTHSTTEIENRLFSLTNRTYFKIRNKHLIWSQKLSQIALEVSKKFYENPDSPVRVATHNIYTFKSFNPTKIPKKFIHSLSTFIKKDQLGINVFYPPDHGLARNLFIITFISKSGSGKVKNNKNKITYIY